MGATALIEIPNGKIIRDTTRRPTPPMVTTGEPERVTHGMGVERRLWSNVLGVGTARQQIPVMGKDGRRHYLTGPPLPVWQKVKISFGNRKKELMKHVVIAAQDLRELL